MRLKRERGRERDREINFKLMNGFYVFLTQRTTNVLKVRNTYNNLECYLKPVLCSLSRVLTIISDLSMRKLQLPSI